jgi:osmotically-inducible protein OsmY
MNNTPRRPWCGLLLGLTVIAAGCSKGDTQRLAGVSRKITEKARILAEDTGQRMSLRWQSANPGLEIRVSQRLHWDKGLANVPIQVEAAGNVVTLKGAVAELAQRQRAVNLAETTEGVEKVVDALQAPEQ